MALHLPLLSQRIGLFRQLPSVVQLSRLRSTSATSSGKRDRANCFFQPAVRAHLESLVRPEDSHVFRVPRRGQPVKAPKYVFATDRQLQKMRERAKAKAKQKLQMPPQLEPRNEHRNIILESDPAITGYDSARLVFTDITFGVHDRDRLIVVREPNGDLREAEWSERDRMNLTYFPREARKHDVPAMFQPGQLKEILRPEKYEYILDRNCVQFEPDHPIYIRTAGAVYKDAANTGQFEVLRSTRHYGPMVFTIVWERAHCDTLLAHYLLKDELDSAAIVVRLFGLMHPDASVATVQEGEDDEALLRRYITKDATSASKLHASLEAMLEAREERRKREAGLREAHGNVNE